MVNLYAATDARAAATGTTAAGTTAPYETILTPRIGILCIRRTLADGRAVGFAAGLGAATADALYGAVAAFGLTLVSTALVGQRAWLQAVGGLFLCYLGVRTWMAAPAATAKATRRGPGLLTA